MLQSRVPKISEAIFSTNQTDRASETREICDRCEKKKKKKKAREGRTCTSKVGGEEEAFSLYI